MAKKNDDINIEEILLRQVAGKYDDRHISNEIPEACQPQREDRSNGTRATSQPKVSLYEEVFLREFPVRERSAIYIRAATKRKLMQVAHRLGWSKVSVTAFADNILSNHLEVFRDEINRLHKLNNSKEII